MNKTKCPRCETPHTELVIGDRAIHKFEQQTHSGNSKFPCDSAYCPNNIKPGDTYYWELYPDNQAHQWCLACAAIFMMNSLNEVMELHRTNRLLIALETPPGPAAGTYTMWACHDCSATFPEPIDMLDHRQCPHCSSADIWSYHETGCEDPDSEPKTGLQCETCGIELDHLKCPDCSSLDIWPYKEQREDPDDESEAKFPVFRYEFNGYGKHRIATTTAAGQKLIGEWQSYHYPAWLRIGQDWYAAFTPFFEGEVPNKLVETVFKLAPQQTENPKEVG